MYLMFELYTAVSTCAGNLLSASISVNVLCAARPHFVAHTLLAALGTEIMSVSVCVGVGGSGFTFWRPKHLNFGCQPTMKKA